jgi:hypothetical protein
VGKSLVLVTALAVALIFTGCSTTDRTSSSPAQTEVTPSSRPAPASPLSPSQLLPTGSVPPGTTPPTVVNRSGPLEGTRSPILGIDVPPGSDGVWIVNDFNDDNKPNNFEQWTVPLGYDEAVALLTEQLNPHYTRPDGMPWLEGDEPEGELGERYVDWWWGVSEPELLVRVQEYGEPNEVTVHVESRSP